MHVIHALEVSDSGFMMGDAEEDIVVVGIGCNFPGGKTQTLKLFFNS
jgi:hypothetical protein